MAIKINIKFEEKKWREINFRSMARQAFEVTLRSLSREDIVEKAEVSILACNDQVMRKYNNQYRDTNDPTDVLSWPRRNQLYEREALISLPNGPTKVGQNDLYELGDVAISYDTCVNQAKELGLKLESHVVHLLVHACLHLLGFSHQKDSDFQIMKDLEIKCLEACGIENPYLL